MGDQGNSCIQDKVRDGNAECTDGYGLRSSDLKSLTVIQGFGFRVPGLGFRF